VRQSAREPDDIPALENGLIAMALPGKRIVVGVLGSRDVLDQLMRHYQSAGESVKLLVPRSISPNLLEDGQWILLLVFDRQQLADAAASLRQRPAGLGRLPPGDSSVTRKGAAPQRGRH
jgi:hypothetical protein